MAHYVESNKKLGPREAQLIRMLTNQMIESVNYVIEQSETLAADTNKILKQLYPGHHIIKITYPNRVSKSKERAHESD